MKHNCHNISMNLNEEIVKPYEAYRNGLQILGNYLTEYFKNWQVYITEHDLNVFRINFCSMNNRVNDATFLITKKQLADFHCTLDHIIIPTLVHLEQSEDCECQM